MLACEKSTTITNVKGVSFAIDKQKGGYPSIYNNEQFLNVDIVNDLGDLFDANALPEMLFSHASIQPSSIAENQGNGAQRSDDF
jgi:hypothetical protein